LNKYIAVTTFQAKKLLQGKFYFSIKSAIIPTKEKYGFIF